MNQPTKNSLSENGLTEPGLTPLPVRPRELAIIGLAILFFWFGSFGLLSLSDPRESEFGGHPDEASHYVTGLMVFDYLKGHLGEHPLRFAEMYYEFYPKVAIGHFPPGFYVIEAVWFLLFGESTNSVLALQSLSGALIAGLVAWLVIAVGGEWFVALSAGALVCTLPLLQRYVGMVMSDSWLSLFCLLSALSFGLYLRRPGYRYSLLFGCLAAATILIKGSGLMLAFVPPISLILTRRYHLFFSRAFWVAALPVVGICGPWMVVTYKITEEGMVQAWSLGYLAEAVPYFLLQAYSTLGFALLALTLLGALRSFNGRVATGRVPEFNAVMLALPLGLVVTYALIPVGFEQRYLLPAVGPALFFFAQGVRRVAEMLEGRLRQPVPGLVVLIAACVFYFVEIFELPEKGFRGFSPLIARMGLPDEGQGKLILVSSDARGEGALVAGVAARDQRPRNQVLRGTKVLSTSDWMGRGYELSHESDEALLQFLERKNIDWLVLDNSIPTERVVKHHEQLSRAIDAYPERFELVEETMILRRYAGERQDAELYRILPASEGVPNP